MKFAIKSRAVLLPNPKGSGSCLTPATVLVEQEKISAILNHNDSEVSVPIIDVGDDVVMPGICDTHVHMNEPGRTEWEGISTATKAAAAGGITTLIDMPLNSIPPTTTVHALELKRKSAKETAFVDYGFWGGVIPENLDSLKPLVEAGVLGFKAFMIDSGVPEFPMAQESVLREGLSILSKLNVPLLVHAEVESKVQIKNLSVTQYQHYLESRPQKWEIDAIKKIISIAEELKARVHVVHLSAANALQEIASAKKRGVLVSAETCPHYLTLKAEDVPEGATHFKCAPPIRENSNRNRLWEGLSDGIIDFIVSDHSPCTPQLKHLDTGNFDSAWGGIAGLQFGLPVIWTELSARGLGVSELSHWLSTATSNFLNLTGKTGKIEKGADADLVVWDPNSEFTLKEDQIFHRHKVTPYLGKKLKGIVKKTFVRGNKVYDLGVFSSVPKGTEVNRR